MWSTITQQISDDLWMILDDSLTNSLLIVVIVVWYWTWYCWDFSLLWHSCALHFHLVQFKHLFWLGNISPWTTNSLKCLTLPCISLSYALLPCSKHSIRCLPFLTDCLYLSFAASFTRFYEDTKFWIQHEWHHTRKCTKNVIPGFLCIFLIFEKNNTVLIQFYSRFDHFSWTYEVVKFWIIKLCLDVSDIIHANKHT